MSGTGEQYEISHQASRAVVTEVGAGLRVYEVGGVGYVQTYAADETPPMGCGAVLVPWPNRTAGATWTFDGDPLALDVTEPARGNAIHGLVRKRPWTLVRHGDTHVELGIDIPAGHGWPEPMRTTIHYDLGDDAGGLTVTHTVHNLGERAVPFGVGTHPYPRPGNEPVDDCVLHLAAAELIEVDPTTMIPTGTRTPAGMSRQRIGDVDLDTAFGGCVPEADGLVHHRVQGAADGVELWADPAFGYVQVFTPGDFHGTGVRAIAVEPMTCPPNALNTGEALITLAAGASWTGRWGVRPLA